MRRFWLSALLLLLFGFLSISVSAQSDSPYERVNVNQLMNELEIRSPSDILLLDVRTPKEFEEGQIAGAVNINLFSNDFENQVNNLDKQKKVYVYCRSGKRSKKASRIMEKLGFSDIKDVDGGFRVYQKLQRSPN